MFKRLGTTHKSFRAICRKLAPSPELTAAENARIAQDAERARKASSRKAAKLPAVAAAAQRKIEKAEKRRRRAEEEFEAWKREFLAKPENRESASAVRSLRFCLRVPPIFRE